MYTQKIIQNIKLDWYYNLSKTDKLKEQTDLKLRHKLAWNNKPIILKRGSIIKATVATYSINKDRQYVVLNHFCTLVSTIYDTKWNQFVTIKNKYGCTVKMNIDKFTI